MSDDLPMPPTSFPDAPKELDPPKPDSAAPEGTVKEKWWQRSATAVAIATTIGFGLFIARPYIIRWIGEEGAALFENVVWAWAFAFGIHRASPGLRAK